LPKHKSITDLAARKLSAKRGEVADHFDASYPGLHLRVSGTGYKAWGHYFRLDTALKRMTFGAYPELSVEQAHDAWRKARDDVRAGRDPRGSSGSQDEFRAVFEEWLKRDQAGNKSVRDIAAKLELHALPYWEHRKIADISKRDAIELLDRIVDAGKVTQACRVHTHLRRLFKWCVERDILAASPMASVSKPGEEVSRDRTLSDDELANVWRAAEKEGYPYGPAVKLLALSGARREEIGQLRWDEIVGDEIISGARTKNGEAHLIPLSKPALAVLKTVPHIAGAGFVFTAGGDKPLNGWGKGKSRLDAGAGIPPWRIHDLRRTVATGLQKLKVPLTVTEAVLGHTAGSRGGIVGVYQRHDYADEKRAALEAWGAHVMALVQP
jgi:integrase